MRRWQYAKWFIILAAPVEVVGCMAMGAFEGFKASLANIKDAWSRSDAARVE